MKRSGAWAYIIFCLSRWLYFKTVPLCFLVLYPPFFLCILNYNLSAYAYPTTESIFFYTVTADIYQLAKKANQILLGHCRYGRVIDPFILHAVLRVAACKQARGPTRP
jgi:hypothetical protein